VAAVTAEYQLRLTAFRFRIFSFVLTGSFFASFHAKAALANASTGIGLLPLGMEHRHRRSKNAVLQTAMSVLTVHNSRLAELGREDAPRERDSIFLSPRAGRGRIAQRSG
jgi:hypothetical protein